MSRVVEPGRRCCPRCFDHPWLKQLIRRESKERGTCSYCGAKNQPVVPVQELSPYFENLMSLYERDTGEPFTHGESLIYRIQDQWSVFNEDHLDEGDRERLLYDIVNYYWDDDDGELPIKASDDFVFAGAPWHDTEVDKWDEYCDAVRDHPEQAGSPAFDDAVVEDMRAKLGVVIKADSLLYRAVRGFNSDSDGNRIPRKGPPPNPGTVRAGRGNREKQVVLYCADQEETAVSEVRPARGMIVSVGAVRLCREARIIDLTLDVGTVNPFISPYPQYETELLALLQGFSEEMSRPQEHDDDETAYLPCQKLCEYFAEQGYDGVRYPSALHEGGTNVLLFDPAIAECAEARLVEIRATSVSYE
jgi:hypothetical protein